MLACIYGHHECAKVLLERGANVALVNRVGATALMYACRKGDHACVAVLIKHGADVDQRVSSGPLEGRTALSFALDYGGGSNERRRACVRLLLEAGADAAAPISDTQGTPLQIATRNCRHDIAQTLRRIVEEKCPRSLKLYDKEKDKWPADFRRAGRELVVMVSCLRHEAVGRPRLHRELVTVVLEKVLEEWMSVHAWECLERHLWWREE